MNNIGVFIDGDNILPSSSKNLFEIIDEIGNPEVINLYGDFSLPQNSGWKYSNRDVNYIQVWTPTARSKNSTDFKMVVDIIKTSFEYPHLQTFIIVSGDADFISTCSELKRKGKTVIIISQKEETTSKNLHTYCHEIIYLESKDEPLEDNTLFQQAHKALLEILRKNDGCLDIANLGGELRKINKNFNNEFFGIKYHWQFIEKLGQGKIEILRGVRLSAKLK